MRVCANPQFVIGGEDRYWCVCVRFRNGQLSKGRKRLLCIGSKVGPNSSRTGEREREREREEGDSIAEFSGSLATQTGAQLSAVSAGGNKLYTHSV